MILKFNPVLNIQAYKSHLICRSIARFIYEQLPCQPLSAFKKGLGFRRFRACAMPYIIHVSRCEEAAENWTKKAADASEIPECSTNHCLQARH